MSWLKHLIFTAIATGYGIWHVSQNRTEYVTLIFTTLMVVYALSNFAENEFNDHG